jgi:hypothetical protein
MKKYLLILALVLSRAGAVRAQLAPANEQGMSWGHLHLYAQDREKEAKAWMALGGRLGMNLSGNIPITFPGILILINFAGVPGRRTHWRQRRIGGGSRCIQGAGPPGNIGDIARPGGGREGFELGFEDRAWHQVRSEFCDHAFSGEDRTSGGQES